MMAGWVVVGQGLCMLDSAAESFSFPTSHPVPRRVASTQLTIRDSGVDSQVCCCGCTQVQETAIGVNAPRLLLGVQGSANKLASREY